MNKERYVEESLRAIEKKSNCKYIIYGFGITGKLTKSILNTEYNIIEDMIIDAKLCNKIKNVYGPDVLCKVDNNKVVILLCATSAIYYEEMIGIINKYNLMYIDICKEIREEEARKTNNQKRMIVRNEKIWDTYINRKMNETNNIFIMSRNGLKFWFPFVFSDYIQSEILLTDDFFETDIFKRLFSTEGYNLPELVDFNNSVIIDIGANIGNHTLYYARELKAKKIISFEPSLSTYCILKKNIELNKVQKQVDIYNYGLSDEESMASYEKYNFENAGGTSLRNNDEGKIQLKKLDDFCFDNVSFIKIDVEGMESSVLRGAIKTIKKCMPIIQIESFPSKFEEIKSFLTELGYGYISISEYSDYLFFDRAHEAFFN